MALSFIRNFQRIINTNVLKIIDKKGLNMDEKNKNDSSIPVWHKPYLTLYEASEYFGIGVNKLRELTNDSSCEFVLYNGTKRLIKRIKFEEYLNKLYSI